MTREAETSIGGPAVEAGAVRPMFSERQLRHLKVAVIVMAVVLIVGFGVVIGRVVYLFQRAAPASGVTTTQPVSTRPELGLVLPAGAVIRHIAISGDRLAVHFEATAGPGIRVIDLATGLQHHIAVASPTPP